MNNNSLTQRNNLKEKIRSEWTSNHQDKRTVCIFLLLATFFTVIGVFLAVYGQRVREYSVIYSEQCGLRPNCTVSIFIEENLEQPVYFYIQLDDFFQNHKQYVVSSEMARFSNADDKYQNDKACYPYITNSEAGKNISVISNTLQSDGPAIPCGVAANTYFNDTFTLRNPLVDKNITLNTTKITWESNYKGMTYREVDLARQWTNLTDERFINWIRLASLNEFRKVWGRIDEDLSPGVYEIYIQNNWDHTKYETQKEIIIGTVNELGNKNILLTVCYLSAAAISWVIVMIFWIKIIRTKKTKRD